MFAPVVGRLGSFAILGYNILHLRCSVVMTEVEKLEQVSSFEGVRLARPFSKKYAYRSGNVYLRITHCDQQLSAPPTPFQFVNSRRSGDCSSIASFTFASSRSSPSLLLKSASCHGRRTIEDLLKQSRRPFRPCEDDGFAVICVSNVMLPRPTHATALV